MKHLQNILFTIIVFSIAISACVIMTPQTQPQKQEQKNTDYGASFDIAPLPPEMPAQYATIRPDQQPLQDYPQPSNFEFYSQKDGTPLRRAEMDSVGKNFRPDIIGSISPDTTRRNRFVSRNDSVFYISFYLDSIFIGSQVDLTGISCGDTASSACTIYTAPSSTLNLNYNSAGSQYGVRLNDNSAGLYLSSPNGSTYAQLTNTNFRGQYTLPGQLFIGSDDGNSWIQQTAAQANITGSGPVNTYQFIGDTSGTVRIRSDYPTANWIGFLSTQKNVLDVRLNNSQPSEGQILQANANGYMAFADPSPGGIYGGSGDVPLFTQAQLDTSGTSETGSAFILGAGDFNNASFNGTEMLYGIMFDNSNNPNCWWCENYMVSTDTGEVTASYLRNGAGGSYLVANRIYGVNTRDVRFSVAAGGSNGTNMLLATVKGATTSTKTVFSADSTGVLSAPTGVLIGSSVIDANTLLDVAGVSKTQKLVGQDLTPGITVDAAQAGTGASASITAAQSSDLAGRFSVTTGTGSTTGRWATITFSSAYTITPIGVIGCEDSDCAGLGLYVNMSTTTMEIFITGTPSDATTYEFAYHVIGGK